MNDFTLTATSNGLFYIDGKTDAFRSWFDDFIPNTNLERGIWGCWFSRLDAESIIRDAQALGFTMNPTIYKN